MCSSDLISVNGGFASARRRPRAFTLIETRETVAVDSLRSVNMTSPRCLLSRGRRDQRDSPRTSPRRSDVGDGPTAVRAVRAIAGDATTREVVRRNSMAMRDRRVHRSAGAAADVSRQRLFLEEPFVSPTTGQVFWLPDLTTFCTFPRQVSRRKARLGRPLELHAVAFADFVPGYSGGTATDLHRLPYSSPRHQAVRDTQVFVRARH